MIRSLEGGLSPCLLATHGRTCWAVTLCWTSLVRWRMSAPLAAPLSPHLSTPSCLRGTEAPTTSIRKSSNPPAPPLVPLSPSGSSFSALYCPHLIIPFDRIPPAPGIRAPAFPPPSLPPEFNSLHPGEHCRRHGEGTDGPQQGIRADKETGDAS